jgi:hypothetical protein
LFAFALESFEEDRGSREQRITDGHAHAGEPTDEAGQIGVVLCAAERGAVRERDVSRRRTTRTFAELAFDDALGGVVDRLRRALLLGASEGADQSYNN